MNWHEYHLTSVRSDLVDVIFFFKGEEEQQEVNLSEVRPAFTLFGKQWGSPRVDVEEMGPSDGCSFVQRCNGVIGWGGAKTCFNTFPPPPFCLV